MALEEYGRKRNFGKTSEPKGRKIIANTFGSLASKNPAFVIHKHAASHLHYDLRLEYAGVLKSWAVPKGPSLDPTVRRLAILVEDHPLEYRHFEGVIPEEEYGAGEVIIWDEGTYQCHGNFDTAFEAGDIKLTFFGKKLRGQFALVRTKMRSSTKGNEWLLIKKRDEWATTEDVLTEAMPHDIRPMLSRLADQPFDRQGWLFEIKWDGYRALTEVELAPIRASGTSVRLYSRRGLDYSQKFAPIFAELKKVNHRAVLDGEIVALDPSGRPNFQQLQNYELTGRGELVYYIFDLLYLDDYSLLMVPLRERKQLLKQLIENLDSSVIKYSAHIETEGKQFFAEAQKQALEGIMAKEAESIYEPGRRSSSWLKIKTDRRQEAVIGGYTEGHGGRKGLGALVLGVYDGNDLSYIGHAGGGFSGDEIKRLLEQLRPLETNESPFLNQPKTNAAVTWVRPELVCEVKFAEWTNSGQMRQPIYLGLREDIDPEQVRRETAGPPPLETELLSDEARSKKQEDKIEVTGKVLTVTNRQKEYWPQENITKGDLIDYYQKVAKVILPYLIDRPQNLNRFPHGITGESFYQKDVPEEQLPEWFETISIHSESSEAINYALCQDEAHLVFLVNLGCIELNPWTSRRVSIDYPDYLFIDLDPEAIEFEAVIEAAQVTKQVLDELGLPAFVKTSGATGLHIYSPTGAKYTYDQVRQLAELLAAMVHGRLPKTTSLERRPARRQGRVYLDYLQNARGQTLAAAYSVRPRPGAPVSAPVRWQEVKQGLDPLAFTMATMPGRIKQFGDLWQGIEKQSFDLKTVLGKLLITPPEAGK